MPAYAFGSPYWVHPQAFPEKWMKDIHAAYLCGPTGHLQTPQIFATNPQLSFGGVGMAPPDSSLGAGATSWAPVAATITDALRVAPRANVHAFVRGLITQSAEAARTGGTGLDPTQRAESSRYATALLAAYP